MYATTTAKDRALELAKQFPPDAAIEDQIM